MCYSVHPADIDVPGALLDAIIEQTRHMAPGLWDLNFRGGGRQIIRGWDASCEGNKQMRFQLGAA